MIGRYLGRRLTLACLWHALPRGVWGSGGISPPPGNFDNTYSRRCIFLDFGGKIKGIQGRLLSGNKVMMNWSVDCCYLTIIRRRRSEYCRIIPETKSRGLFDNIH